MSTTVETPIVRIFFKNQPLKLEIDLLQDLFSGNNWTFTAADVIVSTKNGQLRGHTVTSLRNVTFYAFQEIPYAKPPVGSLRFRDPVPADTWSGIRDATSGLKKCYQIGGVFVNGTYETEDCLYLNVYAPKFPNENNHIPVMVWIYGGAFLNGLATFESFGPHYLMENEVIVVTLNYRVGAFGFLATGDTVIPGNYGLKDQNLALKWVRDNIINFGGDPNQVTIFGQSAGAASVTYHLMSPESKGLFRGAIALSGSVLVPWAYQRDHKATAYYIAQKINGTSVYSLTTTQLLAYLQGLPAKTISDASSSSLKLNSISDYDPMMQGFEFAPVVEPNRPGAFITENMYTAIEQGHMNKVPLLMGVVSEEMLDRGHAQADLMYYAKALDSDPIALVCHDMHLTTDAQKIAAGKGIQQIYGGGFQQALWKVVKFYSDTAFVRGIVQHAKLQSKFSDVYFYEFSYHGSLGGDQTYVDGDERVQHSEDLSYIWTWGNWSGLNTYPKADVLTSERYRELLTNFAKYLNPTPGKGKFVDITWPKVTPDNFQYLSINSTLKVLKDYKKDILDKWDQVYETYAVKPYDTY